ncbi:ubinuclein-2 [Gastrophryne carolinensis]
MSEPRRVPLVCLSPMKQRESTGSVTAESRPPASLLPSVSRSQAARPPLPGSMQHRPLPQSTGHRVQREAPSPPLREAGTAAEEKKSFAEDTVRLVLSLSDPTDESCAEFSYRDLLQTEKKRTGSRDAGQIMSQSVDPFNDDEHQRLEVEMLAKKFEEKYGGKSHRHRKDRMQDLVDIGYGYDETDPFIDNSEAYDELVPASLTTKYGGFYINTGTLQFRQASDSENEDFVDGKKQMTSKVSKLKEEERSFKKRKRKEEMSEKEKPPRKLKVQKQMGVVAFHAHKPDKKKKRLYKDSLSISAMIRKFQKEKKAESMQKKEPKHLMTVTVVNQPPKQDNSTVANDFSDLTLGSDPVLSIFGGGSETELLKEAESALEMLGDIDFDKLLETASSESPTASDPEEIGYSGQSGNQSQLQLPKQELPLPQGLPTHLEKCIEDLRMAAKRFDEEGRKKVFAQEMNIILLDIEKQLQELNPSNRNRVYGYIETFIPCTKDNLVKRLKKNQLNIQDDRLKEPLHKLKLAITNVMPGQLNKYQEDCQAHQAKSAKHQGEDDRDRNPSEEDDEEKPGKRIMGPRKKFCWDDTVRNLLCNLVKIKLGCYQLEPSKSQSAEDYLKKFMETEVKPLWPKGWMQSRMLFKESRSVHNHLTSAPAKKKVIVAPKPKIKESSPKKEQKTSTPIANMGHTLSGSAVASNTTLNSSNCTQVSETICLDDSLDDDLSFKPPSLDSISDVLAVLNNGTAPSSSHIETPTSRPRTALREEKLASIMSKLPLGVPKRVEPPQHTSSLIAGHSTLVPKKPQDQLATANSTVVSGLIAGSSIQNPKVSLEPLPAKLIQQGMQRSLPSELSSPSVPAKSKVLSVSQAKSSSSSLTTSFSSTSTPLISSSDSHGSSTPSILLNSSLQTVKVQTPLQQNYVTPLQATISKSHATPLVRLTSSPQISSTLPDIKTPEKTVGYRTPSSSPTSIPLTTVSRTAVSSVSVIPKNVAVGSNPAFKSPYSLMPPTKLPMSPSTSSSGNLGSQNSTHPKSSSGNNNACLSPTVSPIPSGRGSALQGVKTPSASPKVLNSSPKIVTPAVRQQSPSPKIPASSPVQSPIPSPRMSSPAPNPLNQSPKPSNSSSKTGNSAQPGPVKATISNSTVNVQINRTNQNSSVTNRTHICGATRTVGATKQAMSHRPPSASGSPLSAATVQSASSLLANTSPLTLMASPLSIANPNVTTASLSPFGMLGGLVPVNMPFQFPLELLTFGSDTAGAAVSSGSTSAAFHQNITQSLLKGLQTSSTHTPTMSHSSLPAHLQQTFTDGGQSKLDSKLQRKNL